MTAARVDAGDGLPLTIPALLRDRASRCGDRPLLICDGETLTYRDAEARSAALARALHSRGVRKGAHIGLWLPNGADFVVHWLAAARLGAVTLPLSTFSTPHELCQLIRTADIELLIVTESFRDRDYVDAVVAALPGFDPDQTQPMFRTDVPTLRTVYFAESATRSLAARESSDIEVSLENVERAVHPSDRMVIVHTSGSTSTPKGVIHQHGPLIRHLDNLNQIRRYDGEETLFSNSPFFWIGGFAYGLLGTLVAGATLACSNARDASGVLDLIERAKPTMVNGFAATVAHLPKDPTFAARDLSSIRRGNLWPLLAPEIAPADPELRHNMLGMTEAGSVCLVSADEGDQPELRRGSFGKPAPGFEAIVVDPDTGQRCALREVGELWLRGPFLMEGYYGRTREETFEPDGWYRSGDLFAVDADGFFYFTGRLGDMIKTAGANVSPREVEAAILAESGFVSHVVGLPDRARGERVVAALRIPADAADPDPEQLRSALRTRLSAYKVPQLIVALKDRDVPMLSSGKLDARALKDLLSGR
jgi:acyl-CoA synthetase (AMP-forming)/AMP-acid ligase II